MATSPHSGVILYDTTLFDDEDPMSTALLRDAVFGSALHKADEMAQVRACWVGTDDSLSSVDQTWLEPRDGISMEVATGASNGARWYEYTLRAVLIPKIKADGTPYPIRVELAGASSGGHQVDFGIVAVPRLATVGRYAWGDVDPIYPFKTYTNITSGTPAWLTPDGGSYVLDLPRTLIDEALALESAFWTKTDIGGENVTIQAPMIEIYPLAQTFNAGSTPELWGFSVAEYIGT